MKRFLAQFITSQTSSRKALPRPAKVPASVERLEPRQLLSGVSGLEQALAPQAASPSIAVDASRWDASSILVTFRTDVSPESLRDLPAGVEVGSAIDLLPGLREIRLDDNMPFERALEAFREHWAVLDAEPNYAIGFEATVTPNDPKYTSQWALPKIDAPTAWSATTGSPGVVVAVIDSGVDYNHPDLAANIWRNPGEIPADAIDNDGNGFVDDVYGWDFANNDADPTDDHGHGTHVAGTIAAVGNNGIGVTGVAWQAQVMPLKFLGTNGTGYVSDAVAALNYAVAKGAAISNHSWTTSSYSSTLDTAVRNAAASGHIVVAAAGNDGANADNSPHYPAAFSADNLISVAATTSSDTLASFSNYGARSVDLGAPGVSILSTTRGGGYGLMSGTSMAAPHVSGVVALVRSLHPLWSYRRVIDQVLSTTDPVSSLQGKTVTGGRLNAGSAVASEALPLEKPAPPLAKASGTVVRVTTESQLQAAVKNLTSNTTIVIAPGVYHLSSTLYVRGVQNVAIRGETGNRDDVVLVGRGMSNASYGNVPHGIWMGNVQNALVADLTIRDFYFHPIMLNAGTEAPRLYNLRLVDAGEQFIKSNPDGNGGGVDNGIVEYCRIEYTTTARSDYTQGVDVHTGANWIIRHNVFRNIRSPAGYPLAGHAILMWNRSRNTVTEGNLLLNCQRGIGYGLNANRPDDHYGGVIRNNFVHRSATQSGDVGISLENSADTKVLHNTVILNGTYSNAIEYRYEATTGVEILYNLSDGAVRQRNGATGTVISNVTSAIPSWFVDATAGDLHLTSAAIGAIDLAVLHRSVTHDYDRHSRPIGVAPDIGADEFGVPATPPAVRIIDNGDAGFSTAGSWTLNSKQGHQSDIHYSAKGTGADVATWTFTGLQAGTYQVAATWSTHSNRATDSPFTVLDGTSPLGTVLVNQELAPDDLSDAGAAWEVLGAFTITGETLVVQLSDAANEYVIADAIRIEKLQIAGALSLSFDPASINENGGTATGTLTRTGDTSQELVVALASSDTTEAAVPASVTIPAGASSARFLVTAQDDTEADGTQTVTITASAAGLISGSGPLEVTDAEPAPQAQIIDNGEAGFSTAGDWTLNTKQGHQSDVHYSAKGTGADVATWTFSGLQAGTYQVAATWSTHSNRATDSPFTVIDGASPLGTVRVNQELAPNDFSDAGASWKVLGEFTVTGNTLVVRLSDAANEYVIADAIRIERVNPVVQIVDNGDAGFSTAGDWTLNTKQGHLSDIDYSAKGTGADVAAWTFSGLEAGTYQVAATWNAHSNRATDSPFTVLDGMNPLGTVRVNQELAPGDFSDAGAAWEVLGEFTITGNTLVVRLSDAANEYVLADAIRIERVSAVVQSIDDGDASFSTAGDWTLNTKQGHLSDVHYSAKGTGADVAAWTFTGLEVGTYQVAATWFPHSNRATDSPFTVLDGTNPLGTVRVNQELAPGDFSDAGAAWEVLGEFTIAGNTLVVRLSDAANEYVIADAIRIEGVAGGADSQVANSIATSGQFPHALPDGAVPHPNGRPGGRTQTLRAFSHTAALGFAGTSNTEAFRVRLRPGSGSPLLVSQPSPESVEWRAAAAVSEELLDVERLDAVFAAFEELELLDPPDRQRFSPLEQEALISTPFLKRGYFPK